MSWYVVYELYLLPKQYAFYQYGSSIITSEIKGGSQLFPLKKQALVRFKGSLGLSSKNNECTCLLF